MYIHKLCSDNYIAISVLVLFLSDPTNSRAYAYAMLRPSVCRLQRAYCGPFVAKRCVLEQRLLLTAYRKSYMRNRLVPK